MALLLWPREIPLDGFEGIVNEPGAVALGEACHTKHEKGAIETFEWVENEKGSFRTVWNWYYGGISHLKLNLKIVVLMFATYH
jgi:hypothetical protein